MTGIGMSSVGTSIVWRDELDAIASFSPYFVAHVDRPAEARPTSVLLEDPALVIGPLRERLGVTEDRVAASTWFFSYAARLWSISLATQLRTGTSVALGPDDLWWTDGPAGLTLFLPDPTSGGDAAYEVVDRQLAGLVDAWRDWIAPGALWGNAASSLLGAARILGPDAEPLRAAAAAHPLLIHRARADGRRRSCCLFYRVQPGSYCGDCCLTDDTSRGDR